MATAIGQPYNLPLNLPESGIQIHQATNSISFNAGYSYTPNGGNMIASIVTAIANHPHLFDAGVFSNDFQYSNTQNTAIFSNNYIGQTTNDVVYKFTLTQNMVVTFTHCGSIVADTYMSLLDAAGNLIVDNDDDANGDSNCEATLSFFKKNLLAGTYYVVSEGADYNQEDGVIQTNISGYLNEFNYPDGPPSANSSDPRGVGALGGSFVVSASGGATYSVPILVPVGIGGMQPSLSITYNSQSGNGVVGFGAALSGIAAITRAPKSIYHDTMAKGLTYLGDDAFMLNGQRLIYSTGTGTVGQEGAIYYPESDPFTKVIAHGAYTPTSCDTWFEVQDKNGMKYYYGQLGTTARQTYITGSVTRVNAWYMNRMEDPSGNFMDYQYNMTLNYPYLSAIIYGKNKNITTTFENRVEMVYESRTDFVPFVLEGILGVMDKRLKTIISKTGINIFREYTLAYSETDGFSRLQTVTEKNGAGDELKPTQLNWNNLPSFSQRVDVPIVNDNNVYPNVPFVDQTFKAGDMNGDGITDLIGLMTSGYYYYAHIYNGSLDLNGNIKFLTSISYNLGTNFSRDDLNLLAQKGSSTLTDVDGNGIQEILIPTLQNGNGFWEVVFSVINGTINKAFRFHLIDGSEMPLYTTGDFDNNGKSEVIWTEKGLINNQYPFTIVNYNNDTGKFNSYSFNLTLNSAPEKMFAADYNCDGLTDVLVFIKDNYTIFWNQGNGINAQTFDNNHKTNGSNIGNNRMIRTGDFNGDGLTDFIMNESMSSSWYFALNKGDGTFTKQWACTLPIYDQDVTGKDDDKFDCQVYDFDFDGKSDMVIHKAMYKYETFNNVALYVFDHNYTYWMRSTGTALTQKGQAVISSIESDGFSKYLVTGDFNGDGKTELMNYGHNMYDASGSTAEGCRLYRNPGVVAGTGMMASVTSGYGSTTNISYASLTNSSIYTKGNGENYPVISITPPMSAVQSVDYDNGSLARITENYNYSGAKVHLEGKGFLGFTSTIVTNTTTGAITETGYNTPLNITWVAPSETYSNITLDGKTATTTVKYTFVDKGDKKYFAYPNKKTVIDLDNNTDSTTYHYNTTYGYIKDEKTVFGSTNMYKTTQYGSYVLAGGRYQPTLITVLSKHTDDSQTFTRKTSFTYDPTKGYPLTKVENSGTIGLALTTEFTVYDGFGNLKDYRVSGIGVPLISYHSDYEATNRFVSKKSTIPVSTQTSYLYDTWGNVTSETDETNSANLLTTTQTYDGWGQKTSTTSSDGRKTTYKIGWNDNDVKKKYFTLTQGKSQPWVKTWFDATGRETSSESAGPMGLDLGTTKTYNYKGELTTSWSGQGSLGISEDYTYDTRGRLLTQNTGGGQNIAYSYGNRTVTTTTNGSSTTKIFDAWGGIKTVADPLSGNVAYTYKSLGKPWTINANGAISTMDYDEAGNQKMLKDSNAGTINYTYDAAGRVITQIDNKGNNLVVVYDAFGRTTNSTLKGIRTDYFYGLVAGFAFNRLTKVQTGNNLTSYTYDKYGRQLTDTRVIDGAGQLNFYFTYNPDGQLQTTTYPGGVQVSNEYDAYGNKVKVISAGQTVWELTGAEGKVTTTRLGGSMTATRTLDSQGFLTSLKTMKGSTVLRNMGYQFNAATGNLTWRTGMISQKENFEYDLLDRLKSVKEGVALVETMAMNFQPNGNILSKTGLGIYGYHPTKVHAVNEVDYNINLIPSTIQTISYTAFNKATRLKETVAADSMRLDIMYGPDEQRWKSILKKNGSDQKTIIFAGDYEKVTENGVVRELYYIGSPDGLAAVYVKNAILGGRMYYAHTDHQGSIVSLTDSIGGKVFQASYDAWGKQTVSLNTIGFYRGYTGHEHLPEFGLINMNGRMYDPVLGRFLSPDNYVQAADNSQSFNRFSYCINNPLKYSDPTGDLFWIIPNVSFSPNGGLNFDVTFGVGIPGVFGGQLTVGGGAGGFNASIGGFAGPFNAYVGYSNNGGFMAGAGLGFGGLGNGFNTNMTSIGVNYSSNGGFGFNAYGFQGDTNGNMSFDPSIGYSQSYYYNPKETRQYMSADESSAYGNGPKVPYSSENAKNFALENLGERDGLRHLYADGSTPDGDTYENGLIVHNGEGTVGVTVWEKGWSRKSDVYLGEKAFRTTEMLYIALQHEYAHVSLNYAGYGGSKYHAYQESVAFNLSRQQAREWGMYGLTSYYRDEAAKYGRNVNFTPAYNFTFSIRKIRPVW